MSNCFEAIRLRLLTAIAQEAAGMAEQIADLGGVISAAERPSRDTIIALQSFDYLSQQAQAQAGLITLLAGMNVSQPQMAAAIAAIPLPAMRDRLMRVLGGQPGPAARAEDDIILWAQT